MAEKSFWKQRVRKDTDDVKSWFSSTQGSVIVLLLIGLALWALIQDLIG